MVRQTKANSPGNTTKTPKSKSTTNGRKDSDVRRSPRKRGYKALGDESDEVQAEPHIPIRRPTRKRSRTKAEDAEEADLAGGNLPPESPAGDNEDAFNFEEHDEEGDLGISKKRKKNVEYDSDALDEEEDEKPRPSKKRKRTTFATTFANETQIARKKRKRESP
ncbi:hypothetical protein MPER_01287 [Moniliophthora perniciosa FA553]|nr:hypothetical protein MPER_01287 [Moniliophthora perniciosa FA553]